MVVAPRKGKSLHVLAMQQSRAANVSSSGVITGQGAGIPGESSSVFRSNLADSDLILTVGKSAQKYLNISKRQNLSLENLCILARTTIKSKALMDEE